MKSTVFAILLLAFIAALTLLPGEPKTDTPFQALSETEMLATQGAGSCTNVATTVDISGGYCGDQPCNSYWIGSVKQSKGSYSSCAGETWLGDCIGWSNTKLQTCATRYHYYLPWCIGWPNVTSVPYFDVEVVTCS